MNLAQILPDGGISATWFLGIAMFIIGYLLNSKLTNIETTLKQHGEDIQAIKVNQAKIETEIETLIKRPE